MPISAGAEEAAIGAYWSEPGTPDDMAIELITMLARSVGVALANVALQDSFAAAIAIDNARLNEAAKSEIAARAAVEAELRKLNATLERRIVERTAEIQAQADQLAASQRHFRMLVEGVSDYAIYLLDPEGFITNWNPGAARIKGYGADEIIGRHFSTFYTEDDRDAGVPTNALDVARRTGRYESEGWRVRKDGSRFWASAVIDAIRGEDGEIIGFAKITRDLTERREIEEQLRQAQKMEVVGQLTGGIAHDFNNLLTIITGNADIAARTLDSGGEVARARRAIGNAIKGAERASALTQRLLAFSRRQPLAPRPLDLDRVVTGMSDLLKRSLGELVHLEIASSPGLWAVEADPSQIENALLSLAVNARDAMTDGGTLTVETANAYLDADYAAGHAEVPPGNYVVVAVSDTGIGMAREVLARVFEPFFTTKEVGRGTGLGLSQVYGFVKQSGGHVSVYSEEGSGTTVKIYLPRFNGAAGDEVVPRETGAEARGVRGEIVLVVEDDEEVRAFSADVLRDAGYQVLEAGDGAAALQILERAEQRVGLLFTDVVMPGLSGSELSDRACRLRPDLKVLYTSGYPRNAIVHGGRLDPGVELLPKPFTSRALTERVRGLLDRRTRRHLLLIEGDAAVRLLAVEALQAAGYPTDPAASASEGLNRLRAAQGGYGAVVISTVSQNKDAAALFAELRAHCADLPILVVGETSPTDPSVRRSARIAKPYTAQMIADALTTLGIA